jgi:uncharacterized protein
MLTIEEVLSDAALASPFTHVDKMDVRSRGENGETPLHWMATLGDLKGIGLLLRAGAEIDAVDGDGNAAVHEAVIYRQLGAVQTLVEAGAALDVRNRAGKTPLEIAQEDGFSPVVELLAGQ